MEEVVISTCDETQADPLAKGTRNVSIVHWLHMTLLEFM
jgi:hypothetical protein